MKAEHLKVGDLVYVPWNFNMSLRITAILPPLIYPNYLEFHVDTRSVGIYVPADRELTIIDMIPVLV